MSSSFLRNSSRALIAIARPSGALWCACLLVVVLCSAPLAAVADDDAGGLETKQVADDGAVEVENNRSAKAGKLVPFPEDEEEPSGAAQAKAAAAAESQQATPPAEVKKTTPPKSNFRPRFKPPAVKQVQHTEPAEEEAAAEEEAEVAEEEDAAEAPVARPAAKKVPAKVAAAVSPGKEHVDEAFGKSKTAQNDSDYTEVIDLCRQGMKAGLKQAYQDYARKLMGWAYNRRGEIRSAAGQNEEALADFEAAVEAEGSKGWRAIHNRAVSYASLGRAREAMQDFDLAIELNPEYQNAYFNRGELKYEQADFAGAVADYASAIKIGPPDAAIFNSRGHAYYRMKKFGDALRDYSEAIKLDPTAAAALINRGDTFADIGRYGEAAKDYRAALQADSKLGRAYQAAAWLMATCPDEHYRNEKLALDAAKKAIEIDGDDHRTLETLAAAQANAGRFDEARTTQEKAIAKAPKEEFVTAEKRMSLYQRELAFREQSPQRGNVIEDRAVRQASGAEPVRPSGPSERTARNMPPQGRRPDYQGNPRGQQGARNMPQGNRNARPQRDPEAYQEYEQPPQRRPRSGWWPEPAQRN